MGGVTMRPERAVAGTFTRPITRAGAVVLVPAGGTPRIDRPGLRLGVNAGGHLERLAGRLFPTRSSSARRTTAPSPSRDLGRGGRDRDR
jgi:ABC-type amino acid transport substrate-binding protein